MSAGDRVRLRWGLGIRLRDGVTLHATLYEPWDAPGPGPVIVSMTPYVADTFHERGVYFAAHGYPVLLVDVRGRGNSGGAFRPLIQEAADGYDVVEWAARQPYCDGRVAMWGGSYGGYVQWAVAAARPPSLATIVPVASGCIGVDFPATNNIFSPYVIQWLTFTSGLALQNNLFRDASLWAGWFRDLQAEGCSFAEVDRFVGNPSPVFQEWIGHPVQDAYWAAYNGSPEALAGIDMPVLTITGIHDTNQPGALAHYQRHLANAPDAASRHVLVIGPWDHSGTRTPQRTIGGVDFGEDSLVDLPGLHAAWYNWVLRGGERPHFLARPVAYYVAGANRWRYAAALDAVTARHDPLYLATGPQPASTDHPGRLCAAPSGGPDHYDHDPAALDHVARDLKPRTNYLVDPAAAHIGSPRLVYDSAPFADDLETSGFFDLSLWLSIDRPDTDISVSVHVVGADGGSTLLTSDMMRVRFRLGLDREALVTDDAPFRLDFTHFRFTAQLIRKGEWLRLMIGPLDSIHYQKNYQTGGDVSTELPGDARPIRVRLLHDDAHPSVLRIPVAARDTGDAAPRQAMAVRQCAAPPEPIM